jgi:hypothetical protein
MKRSLRILLSILLSLLLLIIIALIALCIFADRAVKTAIEVAGTQALNVGVTVSHVDLKALRGQITFNDLCIDNPAGYQHTQLLELKNAFIQVDTPSLLSETITIQRFNLDDILLVMEQKGVTNNLQEIIDSIKKDTSEEPPSKGKALLIQELNISNIVVKAKVLPVPGKVDTITLKLSPIKMTNLGSEQKLNTITLSRKILLAIAGGIVEQGSELPQELVGALGTALGTTARIGKQLIETAGPAGTSIIKGTGQIGKELGKGLKGLLDPNSETRKSP